MTLTARDLYQAAANVRNERLLAVKRSNYPFEVVLSKIPPRPTDLEINGICKGERIFARTSEGYHWLFQNARDHTAFIRRYGNIAVSSNCTVIIDSLTEANNMSKTKHFKKARAKVNAKADLPLPRRSWPGSAPSKVIIDEVQKPLKTKADMMDRISYLETCIDQNNGRHEKALDALRLEVSKDISAIYRRFAEGLLEAHISGLKEGSLPRRS